MAFPPWPWGGTRLHTIRKVLEPLAAEAQDTTTRPRRTLRDRLRPPSGNTRRTEPADIATHHSSSATGRASTVTRAATTSSGSTLSRGFIAIAGSTKPKQEAREAHAFLVRECVRRTQETCYGISSKQFPTIRTGLRSDDEAPRALWSSRSPDQRIKHKGGPKAALSSSYGARHSPSILTSQTSRRAIRSRTSTRQRRVVLLAAAVIRAPPRGRKALGRDRLGRR